MKEGRDTKYAAFVERLKPFYDNTQRLFAALKYSPERIQYENGKLAGMWSHANPAITVDGDDDKYPEAMRDTFTAEASNYEVLATLDKWIKLLLYYYRITNEHDPAVARLMQQRVNSDAVLARVQSRNPNIDARITKHNGKQATVNDTHEWDVLVDEYLETLTVRTITDHELHIGSVLAGMLSTLVGSTGKTIAELKLADLIRPGLVAKMLAIQRDKDIQEVELREQLARDLRRPR